MNDNRVSPGDNSKRNLTVRLRRDLVDAAKAMAARQATSISRLVAERIETLWMNDRAYPRHERQARKLLDLGFHLGGVVRPSRDEFHREFGVTFRKVR